MAEATRQPLALPFTPQEGAPEGSTNGALTLDHLGPIVVNADGTMSRILNWDKMTEAERKNTVRVVAKRNKERLAKLNAENEAGGQSLSALDSNIETDSGASRRAEL